MSVINNKGFIDSGVSYLQVIERFPCEVAREGFSSIIDISQESIERIGTSDVFLVNYALVHTITYRSITCPAPKTTVKKYTITIPLKLTTPPAVGVLPVINFTTTIGSEVFTDTCGGCSNGRFNKYTKNVALEFEVAPTPAESTT